MVSAVSLIYPGCKFDVTLALYAVNACARIPEMALRVTASIVGLTTSRDEKPSPVLLDMVVKKTFLLVFCCVAGSRFSTGSTKREAQMEYWLAWKVTMMLDI